MKRWACLRWKRRTKPTHSLCRIQTTLQDSALDQYKLVVLHLQTANRIQSLELATTKVAVEVADSSRKALVNDVSRLTVAVGRWQYVAIAEGVVFVLLTLLYK